MSKRPRTPACRFGGYSNPIKSIPVVGCICGLLLFYGGVAANPLPEPLTLPAALATANNPQHPELLQLEHRLEALRAELGISEGERGFSLDFEARIREVGPSDVVVTDDDSIDDNAASLILTRPLYDFGGQDSRSRALELQRQALATELALAIELRSIDITRRYFAVLNADNRFLAENEALAIGFIRYDNAQQDFELGLVAEIDVLRLQTEYEKIRQARYRAEQQQRLTRAQLAAAMGYPDALPSELVTPAVNLERAIPEDVDALVAQALQHSLDARASEARTRAAQAAIGIAETGDNGSIGLELEVSRYSRETSTRDDWRAGIYFDIPLYSSSAPARVDRATASYREALARQSSAQIHLQLEILELWQELQHQKLAIEGLEIEREYRDRYLDRSRAEYELEFRSDLGDSMIEFSRTNAERLRAIYAFDLAWRRLARLVGDDFLAATPSQ